MALFLKREGKKGYRRPEFFGAVSGRKEKGGVQNEGKKKKPD